MIIANNGGGGGAAQGEEVRRRVNSVGVSLALLLQTAVGKASVCFTSRAWLILVFFAPIGLCQWRINCQWGGFGDWSACDPCTKLQSRSRPMVVFAQFGGSVCGGGATETRACETTQHCPLGDTCRNRFKCASGSCISWSLVCNGDQDCEEDSMDERNCGDVSPDAVCRSAVQTPPNIQQLGVGFDAVTGQERGIVMNTQSFGGQCRPTGRSDQQQHLPAAPEHPELQICGIFTCVSVKPQPFVKVEKDFSEEVYSSKWEYAKQHIFKETVTGTTTGFTNYESHESDTRDEKKQVQILKNHIEVATFQSNAPQYIPISEAFWKALGDLPAVYDYPAYRALLERFGTHYRSEGTLGGSFSAVMQSSRRRSTSRVGFTMQFKECNKPKEFALIIPFSREKCSNDNDGNEDHTSNENNVPLLLKTEVKGGRRITALYNIDLSNPSSNWRAYSDWADSITSFPVVTKHKLRPLYELVKEVQCAGVKKQHLRRAIAQYEAEAHRCHCRPCRNNGLVVRDGAQCKCLACKPGTWGVACEQGTELEGQPGVIHGSWSCWSQWSSCSGGRRSRHRGCSNPAPSAGGLHCNGPSGETSKCEDQEELEYLKTMEPECFDFSMVPRKKCGTPPVLLNGFVLDPKDVNLVGSKLEYRCINEYHLVGTSMIDCMEDQTWSQRPGRCTASKCPSAALPAGVLASPLEGLYSIGERVTLSCPPGQQLLGEAEIICDPSLNFSPSPASVRCSEVTIVEATPPPTAQCQPGEKSSRGKCVCRFPYECGPSLDACAVLSRRAPALLSVCKLHSMRCLGKGHTLAENSACQWPARDAAAAAAACDSCGVGEVCDDQTNACRCKTASECSDSDPGVGGVCVRVGDDVSAPAATLGECEAGRRRCSGENITVVGLLPCDPGL
ncbi:Complement component C7 [Merluccius polli]|uniref:Complement component C7 n=1 Tax=Merluccius polli TaxID=89951 RepID=A0AA47P8W3_MERPO|nr:Complement component C7 [Merluccius polli]